ncbi:MAG: hypothetical protein Q8R30_00620 [bacterium]|nr:hypothetical protein [bacterium]
MNKRDFRGPFVEVSIEGGLVYTGLGITFTNPAEDELISCLRSQGIRVQVVMDGVEIQHARTHEG